MAWNEAIKAAIVQVFGTDDSLAGLYTYAILATVLAIVVLSLLGRAAARIGGDAAGRLALIVVDALRPMGTHPLDRGCLAFQMRRAYV
ncbi:MAG TPA: DUF5654 family protein [Herpetosiphonaceae bacterium]